MKLTIQDKIIAGIIVIHSLLGILWTYWIASQTGFPAFFIASNLALITLGLIAGVGSFMRLRWAAKLGILFFAIQLLQVTDPSFQFTFTLGFNLTISMIWLESGELGINLFALAMLLWCNYRVVASNYAIKGTSV